MNKYIVLILILALPNLMQAQELSFIDFFDLGDEFSGLYQATSSEENYFFEYTKLQQNLNFVSTTLLRTDRNLESIQVLENANIRNQPISFNSLFEVSNDRLLVGSNVEIDSVSYFFTHSYALDFSDPIVHDSIKLNPGEFFLSTTFKKHDNGNFYALGNIAVLPSSNRPVHYIEISPDGLIKEFEPVNLTGTVSTFDRDSTTGKFYLGTLVFNSYLLDSNLNPIDTLIATYINQSMNVTFHLNFASYWCDFKIDELDCYCISPSEDEFTFSLLEYDIADDSLFLRDVTPLHPAEREVDRSVWSTMSRDNQKNTYVAYQEVLGVGGYSTANKLFMTKLDSNNNIIWETELFDEGGLYNLSSSFVDSDENLVLTGACFHADYPGNPRNFVIKLSSDGEVLTSVSNMKNIISIEAYPNPSTDYISISMNYTKDVDYQIYSVDGRLEKQGKVSSFDGKVNISTHSLSSGMHILNVYDSGAIRVAKFVKK